MKHLKKWLLFFLIIFGLSSFTNHKFYVAVFQLEYVQQKNVIQVTSRVFIDDLEKEMNEEYNRKFYIGTSKEVPDLKDYLSRYFSGKIKVKLNGNEKPIKFLGNEIEDDVLICYFTIPAQTPVKKLEIKNTTLFKTFHEQQNIIHTNINSNKKSLLLTNEQPMRILEY
ncbi:DUF6702 family protein [Flavobacterium sp. MK4S-17]|uniref:DUF6702 family protein n=1 Tax=Flavobacterium sp. MK4S-17 TaxID=2543737 RepID=UPI0013579397|nr:DUF6702 family protein [Flavobacterium sp. MK4S-17]